MTGQIIAAACVVASCFLLPAYYAAKDALKCR
jgi:hypothetical protein